MEPLKRQIRYHKKGENTIKDKSVKSGTRADPLPAGKVRALPATPKGLLQQDRPDRSKSIIDWLDSHPLFNIAGMCKLIGYDRSNFTKAKEAGKLPEPLIEPVEIILKQYGYGK